MAVRTDKECVKCHRVKPFSEFYRNPQTKDGFRSECKACKNTRRNHLRATRIVVEDLTATRVCSRCDTEKSVTEFVKSQDTLSGRTSTCRPCHQDRARANKFNVPVGWYDVMLTEQNGGCASCHKPEAESAKGVLHVDHDRKCCPGDTSCGKCVRALLCSNCNVALGHVQDDISRLKALINYLESHERLLTTEGCDSNSST